MNEESKRWILQAKEDHDTAKYLFVGKKYKFAAFHCQQSAEKSLKAVLLRKKNLLRKIHDLVELGKDVSLPDVLLQEVKELTHAYIYTRYPDVRTEGNLKEKVSHFLKISEEILAWSEKNL